MAKKKPKEAPGLIDQLRVAIRGSGQSLNQLSKVTGVGSDRLSRFMTGKRGLSIEALDKIFKALRLQVVPEAGQPRKEDE